MSCHPCLGCLVYLLFWQIWRLEISEADRALHHRLYCTDGYWSLLLLFFSYDVYYSKSMCNLSFDSHLSLWLFMFAMRLLCLHCIMGQVTMAVTTGYCDSHFFLSLFLQCSCDNKKNMLWFPIILRFAILATCLVFFMWQKGLPCIHSNQALLVNLVCLHLIPPCINFLSLCSLVKKNYN